MNEITCCNSNYTTVTVAKLTCDTTWAGISALNYVSKPKSQAQAHTTRSKASPLLEMITAGLYFRIQWILWRLLGYLSAEEH